MTALVKVVTPAQYRTWVRNQRQKIATANSQVLQLRTILTKQGDLGN